MRDEIISPEQFDRLQRVLALMDRDEWNPETATIQACRVIHIKPPTPFEPVNIIVDYSLTSKLRGDRDA
jgi:hypothetical protein